MINNTINKNFYSTSIIKIKNLNSIKVDDFIIMDLKIQLSFACAVKLY